LPKMFEWLASLDDIEYELDDLSERFQRDFSDLDVEVKISLDERQFRRDIDRLESVREILEAINKLQEESDDIFFNVRSNIDELQQGRTSRIFRNQFNEFSRQLSEQVKELEITRDRVQQAVSVGRPPATVGGFAVPSGQINFERQRAALGDLESQIGQFKNIQALISGITFNIAELQEKSSRGVLDSSQLTQTRDLLARLAESITSGAEKLTKADGASLEGATETIGQLQKEIEELIAPAQQFESIVGEQLQAALDATIRKTEQLAAKQQLFRQQIAGTSNEYDVLLFDLSELSKTYEDLIRNTVKFAQEQNRSEQEIRAVKDAIEAQAQQAIENELLTAQLELIEKIRSAEEKLEQLRQRKDSGKSRRTSLEQFTSQLQEAALSIGGVGIDKNTRALQDTTEELEKLRNALDKTNQVQGMINGGGGIQFSDITQGSWNEAAGSFVNWLWKKIAPGQQSDQTADLSSQIQEIALMQPVQRQASAMLASGLGGQIGGILGVLQLAQPGLNLAQARGRFEEDQLRASEWKESFESALRSVLRTESITVDETRKGSSQQPKLQAIGP
jgi:DNA repair exonuclease SbcCD ATPase subunit